MNIFFDVDGTLIGYHDQDLRPGVRETFERLVERGHNVYLWTGQGKPHAVAVAEANSLTHLLSGCFEKPFSQETDRGEAGLARCGVPVTPEFCVDDDPHWHIPQYGGIAVQHFVGVKIQKLADDAMERVYAAILERERMMQHD